MKTYSRKNILIWLLSWPIQILHVLFIRTIPKSLLQLLSIHLSCCNSRWLSWQLWLQEEYKNNTKQSTALKTKSQHNMLKILPNQKLTIQNFPAMQLNSVKFPEKITTMFISRSQITNTMDNLLFPRIHWTRGDISSRNISTSSYRIDIF